MKNTINPKDPIRNEIGLCQSQANSVGEVHDSLSKYDFMTYPDAIPEEVFVYFSSQVDMKQVTQKELILNMHFMNKHF